jgi:hypothetical protein
MRAKIMVSILIQKIDVLFATKHWEFAYNLLVVLIVARTSLYALVPIQPKATVLGVTYVRIFGYKLICIYFPLA